MSGSAYRKNTPPAHIANELPFGRRPSGPSDDERFGVGPPGPVTSDSAFNETTNRPLLSR